MMYCYSLFVVAALNPVWAVEPAPSAGGSVLMHQTSDAKGPTSEAAGIEEHRGSADEVGRFAAESARVIPVAYDVDVVVVGGSTGAVAAAVEAAKAGARVFVAAPRPYLGENVCGTMRFWLERGERPCCPLAKAVFDDKAYRPMRVKRALDNALLDAGVDFLFCCLATDVLADVDGKPAGVLIANRAGRQAVRSKVIIDATDRAWVARRAGAAFRPYTPGPHVFKRVVAGGGLKTGGAITARATKATLAPDPAAAKELLNRYYYTKQVPAKASYEAIECTLAIAMKHGGYSAFAEAEQRARDITFDAQQVEASEFVYQTPPDPMKAEASLAGAWPGAERVDLDAFRPIGCGRMYVLSGCADVSREAAETLTRPNTLMHVGSRVGRAAALEAKNMPRPEPVGLLGPTPAAKPLGELREVLVGVRPTQRGLPTLRAEARGVPVLGSYDVVVIGGGTSGAPAAIGAARRGAKTLVVEYQHALGGVGTTGLIGNYFHGYKAGFTAEVIAGVGSLRAVLVEARKEWWRREIRKAGGEIWLGCLGCGSLVDGRQVKGVIVATPECRGVVLAKVVVDATGNADIAATAGAECVDPWEQDLTVQGAGLPPRGLGMSRNSTDWTFADDNDMVDFCHHAVHAKQRFANAYDLATLVGTRERRRIVGDFELSPLDIVNQRTYPDTVSVAQCFFDSHGFLTHPLFTIQPDIQRTMATAHVPYRCLTPKGLEGILVVGLASSAHRDAMALARMQADMQNRGYAAGVAAAMAASQRGRVRNIDVKKLQKHLVDIEAVPGSVLADRDSYPIPASDIASAVDAFAAGEKSSAGGVPLAKILAQPDQAIPLLQAAHDNCTDTTAEGREKRVRCATALAFLGDRTGVPTLIAELDRAEGLDDGAHYSSWGWTRPSRLDSLTIALGRTGDRRAVGPILRMLKSLDQKGDFSHVRAVALALEALGDPAAAAPLADLLQRRIQSTPMWGHVIKTLEDARQWSDRPARDGRSRYLSLRELTVARALFRCGDHQEIGQRILTAYTQDLRGPVARHALAVLEAQNKR